MFYLKPILSVLGVGVTCRYELEPTKAWADRPWLLPVYGERCRLSNIILDHTFFFFGEDNFSEIPSQK